MDRENSMANQILDFYDELTRETIVIPDGYRIINPYIGEQKEQVQEIAKIFYEKYYNDRRSRRLILGSSPARRGTAVTGVPFEDAQHLQKETGVCIDNFRINRSSSNFLYEVMDEYGGCNRFYSDFYMSFTCPLGIVKTNEKGNEVNCNYYENKKLKECLHIFIVSSVKRQLNFGLDRSVCYCIGSGENYKYLSKINEEYDFFNKIIPLEHPRFIMQYNSKNKNFYIKKYLDALKNK